MTRWGTGREEVEAMLAVGDLELVTASVENAARLLLEAQRHLRSAELVAEADPAGGYDLLYAAARKSMAAVLAVQGLRATSKGGHVAVQNAVAAQLGHSGAVVRPFGRLRRTRNDADYPRLDSPRLSADDIRGPAEGTGHRHRDGAAPASLATLVTLAPADSAQFRIPSGALSS